MCSDAIYQLVPVVYEMSVLSVAVMTLREFQREAARRRDETRETRHLDVYKTKLEAFNKQPKGMEQSIDSASVRNK